MGVEEEHSDGDSEVVDMTLRSRWRSRMKIGIMVMRWRRLECSTSTDPIALVSTCYA